MLNRNVRQSRKIKIIILHMSFFLILISSFNINHIFDNNSIIKNDPNQIDSPFGETKLKLSDSSLDEYSGIGSALNVSEYGNGDFINYNLNLTNNDKGSIIVPNEWSANEITGNIFDIYDYNNYFLNDTFDSGYDSNFWTSYTDRPSKVSFDWYNATSGTNDSIYIRFEGPSTPWVDIASYWNYTFFLPRNQIPYEDWEISFKYRVLFSDPGWLIGTGGTTHSVDVYVNGVSQEFALPKLDSLDQYTWYTGNILFQPEEYNFQLPGTISLLFKIYYGNTIINPSGYFEMYYDNITLKLSTIPKPSQINLTINDITNDISTIINNTAEYGEGTVHLQGLWNGDIGGKTHYFSFSHNSSGNIFLHTEFYTQAVSSKKTITHLGLEGSEFMVENNSKAHWTFELVVNPPGSYSTNYYFNISKPLNWVVTQVIDPYLVNRIDDVIGSGYGNTTLIIPNDIITGGLWKFIAEAPNYVQQANIYKQNGLKWIENATFQIQDTLRINASIKTDFISDIDLTNASLEIFYPNESLFYVEKISVRNDGIVEFSEITLGSTNASVGAYSVYIKWNNYDCNMTQVGVYKLEFIVIHHTSLTAINPYFEQIAGDPLLLKVNYTDVDKNVPIDFAMVTYKSSFGSSGIMLYIGSGVYFAEIDTSLLGLGDYYFSFNASKIGYQNQTETNLIHLKIMAQPLAIEVPHTVISAIGNNYAICQINITGAISGALITDGANITTDWENPYFVDDHENGTFTLQFSTDNLPTQGIIETYLVTIYANKTDYGYTHNYISIQISPIPTIANINETIVSVVLHENFSLKLNYTVDGSGELIYNSTLKVNWASDYTILSVVDGFIIDFSTYNLSLQIYTLIFQLNCSGYETAFKSIYVNILPQPTYLEIFLNGQDKTSDKSIEIFRDQPLNITIFYMDSITDSFISGAIVTLNGTGISKIVSENGSQYTTLFNAGELSVGTHFLTISIEKENYNFVSGILKIAVEKIKINANTIDFQDSLEFYPGSSKLIKINLTELNSGTPIENANITFSWRYDVGDFEYTGNGIYQAQLNVEKEITYGTYRVSITITTESGYYETKEISFLLIVSPESEPNYLLWVIIILLVIVSGVLGTFITRNYVILPKKRKKEELFLSKIQAFRDLQNIQGLMLVKKDSGMPFYTKNISEYGFEDNILVSGFIQAITLFGEQAFKVDDSEEKKPKSKSKYSENTIELNFRFFHLLICDFDPLRSILILKDKSSDNLRKQFYLLSAEILNRFSEKIRRFQGATIDFESELDFLINKFLFLYYNEPFKLVKEDAFNEFVGKSRELRTLESRLLNVIISLSKYKQEFTFDLVIKEIDEKNID
ncbi:MAG: hypothetical protein ACFFDH_13500, partial [Promethearchaeota archaeon]